VKIIVSQQGGKINITFKGKNLEESFVVAQAEDFLACVDKLIRKRRISPTGLIRHIGHIEFYNTGLLTERIIRSIILGLCF